MSFIETLAMGNAPPETCAMYARQQAHFGYLPNYATGVLLSSRCHGELGGPAGQHPSPCGPQTLRARHPGCRCRPWATAIARCAHGRALATLVGPDDALAIAEGREPSGLTDEERAILPFARKVARDATKVTQDDIDRLRHAGLDDAEIFDIIVVTAARAFFTTLLDGLGVQADGAFADMEEGLRQALTVGRPIAGVESAGVESAGAEDGHHAPVFVLSDAARRPRAAPQRQGASAAPEWVTAGS